ncbi:agmatine deiminase family protein [Streptomyces sp. NPDC013457]|uniref:agmatine deiminase family protein n=1 Tax=Streptomyces sp. NPDC013457 TaxID=3364866 RepID=UPI0036FB42BB
MRQVDDLEAPAPGVGRLAEHGAGLVGRAGPGVRGEFISAHFGDTRADQAARATLARLYPDRVIEQLNIDRLGAGGGSIHCVTQQQPVA